MAPEKQGERVPLLAREGEVPRLRVRDDNVAKASRWSRVAMMASGAVALGVAATYSRTGVFTGTAEASLGLPVKVEEVEPFADQNKGPVFIHIPKNGGTSIELLAAYNGVRYVARAHTDASATTVSSEEIALGRPLGEYRWGPVADVHAVLPSVTPRHASHKRFLFARAYSRRATDPSHRSSRRRRFVPEHADARLPSSPLLLSVWKKIWHVRGNRPRQLRVRVRVQDNTRFQLQRVAPSAAAPIVHLPRREAGIRRHRRFVLYVTQPLRPAGESVSTQIRP